MVLGTSRSRESTRIAPFSPRALFIFSACRQVVCYFRQVLQQLGKSLNQQQPMKTKIHELTFLLKFVIEMDTLTHTIRFVENL